MRIVVVAMVVAMVAGLAGCEVMSAFRDTETVEFAEWFGERLPAASEVGVQGGVVSLTMPDGSVESRPLPASADFDEPGAVFGKKAVEGIHKSLETGSPWPAVAMTVEGLALAAAAWFAKRKRDEAREQKELYFAADELAEIRDGQLEAAVLGLKAANIDAVAKASVAAAVKKLAVQKNVERGETGLERIVELLGANVANAEDGS